MSEPAFLESVEWGPTGLTEADVVNGVPVATHAGVFKIGDFELRCYRLSDGQAIIHADDFGKFFGFGLPIAEPAPKE